MDLHSVLDHFFKGFMPQLGRLFGKVFKKLALWMHWDSSKVWEFSLL